jgi:hypothetical protein
VVQLAKVLSVDHLILNSSISDEHYPSIFSLSAGVMDPESGRAGSGPCDSIALIHFVGVR